MAAFGSATGTSAGAALVDADLSAPLFVTDPFPCYESLRTAGPLVRERRTGVWIALGHREVSDVLRRPSFVGVDLRHDIASVGQRSRCPMPALDRVLAANLPIDPSPEHPARHRQLARAIDARSVAALGDGIRDTVQELFERGYRDGGMDLCADFADRLPYIVVARLLGLPDADAPFLFRTVSGFLGVFDIGCPVATYRAWDGASRELLDYLERAIARRRARPGEDVLSRMIALADEEGRDDGVVAERCAFIIQSGVETTAGFLGLALRLLVERPDALDRIRTGEAAVGAAVEELVRLVSPIQRTIRVASVPADVAGAHIGTGEKVVLLIGAANRDPLVYDDPAAADFAREGPPHLAFATGAHTCIGAALARLEGRAAIDGLGRLPKARALGAPVEWWPARTSRRMRSYPVVFGHG